MKKFLTGLAVASMAIAGLAGSASAAPTTTTIHDAIVARWNAEIEAAIPAVVPVPTGSTEAAFEALTKATALEFLEDAGVRSLLDSCGLPYYTAFIPSWFVINGLATKLGYASASSALELAPDAIKGLLGYHVVPGYYSSDALKNDLSTNLTNAVGASLAVEGDGTDFTVDGNKVTVSSGSAVACNGGVNFFDGKGILIPAGDPGALTCGINAPGKCTAAPAAGSGSGLPATGSESMALTYAALASLIAGAGVLVLRRRSVA